MLLFYNFLTASPKLASSQSLLVAQSVMPSGSNTRTITNEAAFSLLSDDQKLLEFFKF